MEIAAAKSIIGKTGSQITKTTEGKFSRFAEKVGDRYTKTLEDGTKKLDTKKTLRDSIIGFGLAAAAYIGLKPKATSSSGEMPPAGH